MRIAQNSLAAATAVWLLATGTVAAQTVEVFKTSGCGCCVKWVELVRDAGYDVVASDVPTAKLMQIKTEAGLAPELASCHTARVGGYVIEGHVPLEDIERLLSLKPDVIGLAVPGMPAGSPGMEVGETEPYTVLLVKRDGSSEVFAEHG